MKLCESAYSALFNIASGSKESAGLLIGLGGGGIAAKVRTKWPDNNGIQTQLQKLTCNFDDASLLAIQRAMTETNDESACMNVAVEDEEDEKGSLEDLRKMIQGLIHSDSAKVNATLDAFDLNLNRDEKENDKRQDSNSGATPERFDSSGDCSGE